jgi:hypothetical protein
VPSLCSGIRNYHISEPARHLWSNKERKLRVSLSCGKKREKGGGRPENPRTQRLPARDRRWRAPASRKGEKVPKRGMGSRCRLYYRIGWGTRFSGAIQKSMNLFSHQTFVFDPTLTELLNSILKLCRVMVVLFVDIF